MYAVLRLEAAHVGDAVLFQNSREICLGHVVGEGAVAEYAGGIAGRRPCLSPRDNALPNGLDLLARNPFGETRYQHAAADAVNGFASERPGFDGDAQIEA